MKRNYEKPNYEKHSYEKFFYLLLRIVGYGAAAFMAASTISLLAGYSYMEAREAIILAAIYVGAAAGLFGGFFRLMREGRDERFFR